MHLIKLNAKFKSTHTFFARIFFKKNQNLTIVHNLVFTKLNQPIVLSIFKNKIKYICSVKKKLKYRRIKNCVFYIVFICHSY